ncbi:glycoside hydrolase domain protein [Natronomonas pharaonis DSM 2160]|uniref:Glycoside hydrolase domain protein n=1 Tax=Natronomonas pharaonis (strain ATCC 35678 / DSM 2160 / CIP 103997 / JCM 8858 / NBRC 14720 / NCIMB 2260 / Gabara) TaxID=348780 RepID=A0A1U7EXF2_NATPD|nr:hypothetical protein [Natronomonas pharaonis]CAI49852.1 glycoside hydrolase domain protein [Natronomonas pharaonis DSM 2160]
MYGVVTRNEEETRWDDFDRAFYEVKDVSGRSSEPAAETVSMVSCFGDNAAAEENPELVPVTPDGERATREQTYFDWAYICPTHDDYRAGLLEIIADCADVTPDVRLDDVGFPRPEYCYCDRCNEHFESWVRNRHEAGEGPPPEETGVEDRYEWRSEVITSFVAEAADRIPGRTYLTLYPDPYEGHLYERAGLDIGALESYVDEFIVPLYDTSYGTTYWLEAIAKGFESRLDTPFSIELYAVDVDIDNLIHATEVAEQYGESVLFGYDAANGRAALRRRRADAREGVEW